MSTPVDVFNGCRGYQVARAADPSKALGPDTLITLRGVPVPWDDAGLTAARQSCEEAWQSVLAWEAELKRPQHPPADRLVSLIREGRALGASDASNRVRSEAWLVVAGASGTLASETSALRFNRKIQLGVDAFGAVQQAMSADPTNASAACAYAETLEGIDHGTHSGFASLGRKAGKDPEKDTCQRLGIQSLDAEIAATVKRLDAFWTPDAGQWKRRLVALQQARAQRR